MTAGEYVSFQTSGWHVSNMSPILHYIPLIYKHLSLIYVCLLTRANSYSACYYLLSLILLCHNPSLTSSISIRSMLSVRP